MNTRFVQDKHSHVTREQILHSSWHIRGEEKNVNNIIHYAK